MMKTFVRLSALILLVYSMNTTAASFEPASCFESACEDTYEFYAHLYIGQKQDDYRFFGPFTWEDIGYGGLAIHFYSFPSTKSLKTATYAIQTLPYRSDTDMKIYRLRGGDNVIFPYYAPSQWDWYYPGHDPDEDDGYGYNEQVWLQRDSNYDSPEDAMGYTVVITPYGSWTEPFIVLITEQNASSYGRNYD